ncbi:MAG: T9SS type A sorting domain-containing protein [Crocinitomicaceae bacterium]|jgi:hypothetical protein|nr:T9SS type A sorting domain-containing protein [Crocinitomicaceae bacterium]
MNNIKLIFASLLFIAPAVLTKAQTVVWSEPFNASTVIGSGGWNLTASMGINDPYANFFTINDNEGGVAPPGCGVAGNGDQTLHITNTLFPTIGAAYNSGGLCGSGFCVATHVRAESEIFSTIGSSNMLFEFDYISNGSAGADFGTVWYNDGSGWTQLGSALVSPTCSSGQGQWTAFSMNLPTSCDNNPTVQVGFGWENNDDGVGTDPSLAVNDVKIIIAATTSSFSVSQCDSYTVPSGDETYTSSGTYIDTITNSAGADSVMTITVTINNSNTGTDIQSACDTYTWIDGNSYTSSNSTATHTLTNVAGCDSVVTLNLTINTVSSAVTQTGALLTADEIGATYQWLNCPSMTSITGANGQSYTATANGDYAVIVTNNGCSDTSACYTVTGVGIIENDFGNRLLLYPNPTNGEFSIDLGETYDAVTIAMTDLNGKLIQSKSYYGLQLLNLDLDEPAGVYLLMIESGEKKAVIRLIKE